MLRLNERCFVVAVIWLAVAACGSNPEATTPAQEEELVGLREGTREARAVYFSGRRTGSSSSMSFRR